MTTDSVIFTTDTIGTLEDTSGTMPGDTRAGATSRAETICMAAVMDESDTVPEIVVPVIEALESRDPDQPRSSWSWQ